MADTYLAWWTSIEVDLRKSLVINAMRDHGAMHSLIRTAFEAGQSSATPPSPSTAPDELLDMLGRVHPYAMPMEDFERAEQRLQRAVDLQQPLPVPDQAAIVWRGDLMRLIDELQHKRSVFDDWKKMRAALASRPAEVDDEGLPPLPTSAWKTMDIGLGSTHYYTAEQFRQGQRDAVAADRAKVSRAMGLLREARATLETWKDMAPAVSLCADIDKVLAGGGQ